MIPIPQRPTSGDQVLAWAQAAQRTLQALVPRTPSSSGLRLRYTHSGVDFDTDGGSIADSPRRDGSHPWEVFFPVIGGVVSDTPKCAICPGKVYSGPGTDDEISVGGEPLWSGASGAFDVPAIGHWGWLKVSQNAEADVLSVILQFGTPGLGVTQGYEFAGTSPNYIASTYRPIFEVVEETNPGPGLICSGPSGRRKIRQYAMTNFITTIWDINGFPARVCDPI